MIDRFEFPNKKKLNFERFLPNSRLSTNYQPIYFLPCKEIEGELIPDIDNSVYFTLDQMDFEDLTQDFFTKPDSINELYEYSDYKEIIKEKISFIEMSDKQLSVTNKVLIQSATSDAADQGYKDLVVGYLDQESGVFVQGCFIKDFYKYQCFNMLDYYMYSTYKEFYLNEDLLDNKVDEYAERFQSEIIDSDTLVTIFHNLKRSCLEGSFERSYSEEYKEMNQEIMYLLSKHIKNYKQERDIGKLITICNHLQNLEVLEFYVDLNNGRFAPLSEVMKKQSKHEDMSRLSMTIGFHSRLQKILKDRY